MLAAPAGDVQETVRAGRASRAHVAHRPLCATSQTLCGQCANSPELDP